MTIAPPAFWWGRPPAAAYLLAPLATVWGAGAAWRMHQPPGMRPPVPVICVGNFTVGGAGKTPTVVALAEIARTRGFKPGILASGYGGSAHVPVLVERGPHTAAEVGDEALLLAACAPTVVARDRPAGGALLLKANVDLMLMDDGFQDPALAKDLALIVVDAATGIGNGRVLPLGPLRAPLAAQLARTDALLVVGEGNAADPVMRRLTGKPVLRATLFPVTTHQWQVGRLLAFAGIGRPEKFFASLRATGANLAVTRAFGDHHRLTAAEGGALLAEAKRDGLRLVTTEKDMARLAGATGRLAELRDHAEVFAVKLRFADPAAIVALIDQAMRKAAAALGRDQGRPPATGPIAARSPGSG